MPLIAKGLGGAITLRSGASTITIACVAKPSCGVDAGGRMLAAEATAPSTEALWTYAITRENGIAREGGDMILPVAGYADEGIAREHDKDLSPVPRDLEVYAHIEGLVGEENELLQQAEDARKEEHRERLRTIGKELDRAWETLRRRAERRARPSS